LAAPRANVLIIGYGFRDKDINDVLEAAIKKYGVKLYAVSLLSLSDFSSTLFKKQNSEIMNGLAGSYFQCSSGDFMAHGSGDLLASLR
jgi:hypothetical protein